MASNLGVGDFDVSRIEKVSDVRHSGVTITSDEFLFFCHIVKKMNIR